MQATSDTSDSSCSDGDDDGLLNAAGDGDDHKLVLLHTSPDLAPWTQAVKLLESIASGQISEPEPLVSAIEELGSLKPGSSTGLLALLTEEPPHLVDCIRAAAERAMEAQTLLLPNEPRLLLRENRHVVQLTQRQIASILALGFFSLLPAAPGLGLRNDGKLTFSGWFDGSGQREKLLCLLHYFGKIQARFSAPSHQGRTVTFRRKQAADMPLTEWEERTEIPLQPVVIKNGPNDRIEHGAGPGGLQVDFAHAAVGGAVLGGGQAQEEIRFVICPELCVCVLLCAQMGRLDAIEVCGVEQFSRLPHT